MRKTMGAAFVVAIAATWPAAAQPVSPQPEFYDMSEVSSDWFYRDGSAEEGRPVWFLLRAGPRSFPPNCSIRLRPNDQLTPATFAIYAGNLSDAEYGAFFEQGGLEIADMSERTAVTVDGAPAVQSTLDASMGGVSFTMLNTQMYRAGNIVSVLCSAVPDDFDDRRAAFEAFLDDVEFLSAE